MRMPAVSSRRLIYSLLSILAWLPAHGLQANCDGFIRWSAASLDDYQRAHRVYPLDPALRALAIRVMPALWVSPDSWKPIDFDRYLAQATLHAPKAPEDRQSGERAIATIKAMDRETQCDTWLESPEQPPAEIAPVYIQAYRDHGPTDQSPWLYLKYTYVFDWSGLAQKRSVSSRIGAALTGGRAARWHRLDVHTSAIVGLDAQQRVRTLTLQQHNNKRTYVAGLDFDVSALPDQRLQLAAAYSTNELYLDTGADRVEERRAVATFLQWPHLIDGNRKTVMWQRDELRGRNSGGLPIALRPVFIEPDHPLAAYAGLLAPRRRLLGLYVGRDGPPGYDFDGLTDLPEITTIGFWREGDNELLDVLDTALDGFQSTDWNQIAAHLRPKLAAALAQTDTD